MRNAFMRGIFEACKKRDDIIILSGDTGAGLFDDFKKQYPDRFINMGIAEQNMASFAAGLALTGRKVVIYNIIPFLLYRCYEQVRNDICYQGLPVVLVGVGSGVTYAPQGMTHYAVEDLGIAQTLPNLVVLSPGDSVEAVASARFSLCCDMPVYVRIAKVGGPELHPPTTEYLNVVMPHVVRPGHPNSETAVAFHGSISSEVLAAYDSLAKESLEPTLISVPMVQPFNGEAFARITNGLKRVMVVEEHYDNCGLGSIIANNQYLWEHASWDLVNMGIPPGFIHEVKDLPSMRRFFGISAYDVIDEVKEHDGKRT